MRFVCCVAAVMMFAAGGSAGADGVRSFDAGAYYVSSGNNGSSLQSGRAKEAAPEPGSVALLGMSLLGFAGVMRRRFGG